MHILLTCHAVVGFVLAFVVRDHIGVLLAPDYFARHVFAYAYKQFDLGQLQRRAIRRLQYAVAWHCLLTGFAHIYHAEHLRLHALRDAAMSQPVPYGCGNNWDWDRLTLAERLRDSVLTDTVQRCAEYMRLTTIDIYPNALFVLVDTVVLAPLRAVDALADTVGSSVAHFLSHFSLLFRLLGWLFQLLLFALVPVVALLACWLWPRGAARAPPGPAPPARAPRQLKDIETTPSLLIEEVHWD